MKKIFVAGFISAAAMVALTYAYAANLLPAASEARGAPLYFHGRQVPPDPFSAASTTVAGIDSNKNGIRDEVDRYIAQTYGNNERMYKAANMLARASQRLLVTDPADVNASKTAMFSSADSGVCLGLAMDDNIRLASKMLDDMIDRTYDTRARRKHANEVRHAVGWFVRSVGAAVCD